MICITNPLDAMVWALREFSGLPHNKVVGMAGVLDSTLATFLAREFDVSVKDVNAFVLGGHGDTMVPVTSYTTINGIPVNDFAKIKGVSASRIDEIVDRTLRAAARSSACSATARPITPRHQRDRDGRSLSRRHQAHLPCASYVEGKYGLDGLYVGVPTMIARGTEEVIEIELSDEEKATKVSTDAVEELLGACKGLDSSPA